MGERDAEQSLHLASPRGGSSLLLQVRRLRSLSHVLLLLGRACPLPALGRQIFLQERAQTPLSLIAERLVLPLALFSGYILFFPQRYQNEAVQNAAATDHLSFGNSSSIISMHSPQAAGLSCPSTSTS